MIKDKACGLFPPSDWLLLSSEHTQCILYHFWQNAVLLVQQIKYKPSDTIVIYRASTLLSIFVLHGRMLEIIFALFKGLYKSGKDSELNASVCIKEIDRFTLALS